MSFNYVVRSVGYSLGSAIGGLILAAGTGPGHLFPDDSVYTTAALVGIRRHGGHDADKLRSCPPTLVRDQPVSQMHSSQHWRFHA